MLRVIEDVVVEVDPIETAETTIVDIDLESETTEEVSDIYETDSADVLKMTDLLIQEMSGITNDGTLCDNIVNITENQSEAVQLWAE